MTRLLAPAWVLALLSAVPAVAAAQTEAPAHLSRVDGQATVARVSGAQSAVADLPLLPGDRIETGQGRVELVFGDGSILHMDEQTVVDVNAGTVVRLLGGRLVLSTEYDGAALRVDAAPASVRLVDSGEVRVTLDASTGALLLDVGVVRGDAEVASEAGVEQVRAGERVVVSAGEAPSAPMAFNSAWEDGFYRWSTELLDSRRGTTSAAYLPSDLTTYAGTFDQYGTWGYLAPYGYVWYPSVAPTWRPYHHGRWQHVGGIGWTFVGQDPWGWPTHHYGRWGSTAAGTWYWIPASGWSAAWVEWAVAPGYVGWCPLGWDNRPVGRFWTGDRRHRDERGRTARRDEGTPGQRHGRGWSVVRSTAFARGGDAGTVAVDPTAIRGPGAPAFAFQRSAPNVAIPRGTVSIPNARVPMPRETVVVPRGRVVLPDASSAVNEPPRRERPPRTGFADRSATAVPDGATPARSRMMRTPGTGAPPVIYYRGSAIAPDSQRGAVSAYERAGVAVPRGLPVGAIPSAPASGGSVSGLSRGAPPSGSGMSARPGSAAAPVAPRGGSFQGPGSAHPAPPAAPATAVPRGAAAPASPGSARSSAGASAQGTAAPRSGSPHR